jgi:hypothetical protein
LTNTTLGGAKELRIFYVRISDGGGFITDSESGNFGRHHKWQGRMFVGWPWTTTKWGLKKIRIRRNGYFA